MSIILLLFISAGLNAQFYEYGQDAGSVKWSQFHTPNYHVIYPRGIDTIAFAFANRLEYFYPHLGRPLNHWHSNMPVIIHNESSFSNGVFVWAPKRLEIFTNPDPNGYQFDWLTELALHEGRHAVQIDKLNQGFTRFLSIFGGEQVIGAIAGFLPYWYLEGDAVDAETRLSNSGRGRQPSFEMELKAQMLESDRLYSFSKATLGSYKDYIPNHYKLGYLLVRHGRLTYGVDFFLDFQNYVARKPFLISPTYFSLKKYGIGSKYQFYREAMDSYRHYWHVTDSLRNFTEFVDWNTNRDKHYTSYTFPHPISNSLLCVYKSGKDQIPEFIFMGKNGEEERIFRPGYLSSGRISVSDRHIVWDEFVPDTRWSNRNYSVIRTFEIATGKVKNLGHKTRYYSPAVSHNGYKIAAIEQTEKQQFNLVILTINGTVIKKVRSPDNQFLQHPSWMEEDSALVVITSSTSGKFLDCYNIASNKWSRIMSAGYDDISHPVIKGTRIFFSGTFTGIDNIFCHDLSDSKTYQITSSRFGAFHPQLSADGMELIYSNYGSKGYGIASLELDKGLWKPLEAARDHREQPDYPQTEYEKDVIGNFSPVDTATYVTKKYNKTLNLFNFHSWLPFYFDYLNPVLNLDPRHLPLSPGFSLVSQNRLSTAVSQVGYEYRNGYHIFHSGIKMKGRYPVLNLYFDYGGEPDIILMDEGDSILAFPNNMKFTAQTYIPLRFNTGKFNTIVQPRIEYNYRRDIQYVSQEDNYRAGAHYVYYTIYASSYLRRGTREILPRFGFSASADYYHAPFNNQVFGSVSKYGFTGYIPGLLKHQTIKVTLNYQKQHPVNRTHPAFINLMSLPRGVKGIFGAELTRYSVDYVFPFLYPDLELGPFFYIKRFRGAFWADYMSGKNVIIDDPHPHYENRNYTTTGFDMVVDMNLLRIPFPVSVGGRVILEPQTGQYRFEWIYSVDIN